MYWRPYIREDDGITPGGGVVKPRPQPYPSRYHGKLACYEGDPVYCNTCKSWGVTKCVPPYRPDTDSEGRQANLDGDLCLCKCPTPPRLKASFDNVRMGFEEYEIAAMAGALSWFAYAGHLGRNYSDEQIQFKTPEGKTIANTAYQLTLSDGSIEKGRTDADGKTSRVITKIPTKIIKVVFNLDDAHGGYEHE